MPYVLTTTRAAVRIKPEGRRDGGICALVVSGQRFAALGLVAAVADVAKRHHNRQARAAANAHAAVADARAAAADARAVASRARS